MIGGDFNFELNPKDDSHLYTDNVKNDSEAYSYALKYFRDLGRDAGETAEVAAAWTAAYTTLSGFMIDAARGGVSEEAAP